VNKEIVVVEAPSNLGLREPSPGNEPGVRFLSKSLINAGLLEKLNVKSSTFVMPPAYSAKIDEDSGVLNGVKIKEYSLELSKALDLQISSDNFCVVLGGDCSVLIGIALSLRKKGTYGLMFIDGHTDFVWPEYSSSKAAAAMELAIVTGNGNEKLSNIELLSPYVRENDVFCVGNREDDPMVVQLINESEIHYEDLNSIRIKGIENIVNDFFTHIQKRKLDGFWIHLDVDVLNDQIMPCVDHRQKGGLTYDELHAILYPLLNSDLVYGIDITIFDPELDSSGEVARELTSYTVKWFSPLISK